MAKTLSASNFMDYWVRIPIEAHLLWALLFDYLKLMKALEILKTVNEVDEFYQEKIKLLTQVIQYPNVGCLIDKNLVNWALRHKLLVTPNYDSKTVWWTCKEQIN
jgi:hypothetical protein